MKKFLDPVFTLFVVMLSISVIILLFFKGMDMADFVMNHIWETLVFICGLCWGINKSKYNVLLIKSIIYPAIVGLLIGLLGGIFISESLFIVPIGIIIVYLLLIPFILVIVERLSKKK